MAKLNTRMQHLAAKEDVQSLKTLIAEKQDSTLKWGIGILISVVAGIAALLVKLSL